MARTNDVKRTIWNGTGIVVSILLAFAIEASWDARSERMEEEAVVEGLREEFEVNLRQLDEMLTEYQRQDSLLRRFFDLATPDTEDEAEREVGRFVLALLWADEFDASTGTLEMMLSAGRLDLISSSELRNVLWTWKKQYEDTQDEALETVADIEILRARKVQGEILQHNSALYDLKIALGSKLVARWRNRYKRANTD